MLRQGSSRLMLQSFIDHLSIAESQRNATTCIQVGNNAGHLEYTLPISRLGWNILYPCSRFRQLSLRCPQHEAAHMVLQRTGRRRSEAAQGSRALATSCQMRRLHGTPLSRVVMCPELAEIWFSSHCCAAAYVTLRMQLLQHQRGKSGTCVRRGPIL